MTEKNRFVIKEIYYGTDPGVSHVASAFGQVEEIFFCILYQRLHISAVSNLFVCPFFICQKQKPAVSTRPEYQDTVDPEYEDFRAEAGLQRNRQLESFAKAAEAFKQGRKEVASFYAQQVMS